MSLFSDASPSVQDPFLARALHLARRGRGTTAPNPNVGCVIVKGGRIVGEGFHVRAGEPHAEVLALANAGEQAAGGDVYVTLEPCAHHGRTPPCTEALIAAGVRSVTIGMRDPNPAAAGGVERLREAGVKVRVSGDPTPFAELNAGWLKRLASGVPRVLVKVGASLDGSLSLAPDRRASMTGPSGLEVTRRLRSCVDAVLVGAATVRIDDPELTIRDADGRLADRQPLRVVLTRRTMPQPGARVLTDGRAPTLVLTADAAVAAGLPTGTGAFSVLLYDEAEGVVGALRALGSQGVNDVLVEAGPSLLTAFLESDAIDVLVVVTGGGFAGPRAPRMLASGSIPSDGAAGTTESDTPSAIDDLRETLVRPFAAREAAVVGDVAVTVWERSSVETDE